MSEADDIARELGTVAQGAPEGSCSRYTFEAGIKAAKSPFKKSDAAIWITMIAATAAYVDHIFMATANLRDKLSPEAEEHLAVAAKEMMQYLDDAVKAGGPDVSEPLENTLDHPEDGK